MEKRDYFWDVHSIDFCFRLLVVVVFGRFLLQLLGRLGGGSGGGDSGGGDSDGDGGVGVGVAVGVAAAVGGGGGGLGRRVGCIDDGTQGVRLSIEWREAQSRELSVLERDPARVQLLSLLSRDESSLACCVLSTHPPHTLSMNTIGRTLDADAVPLLEVLTTGEFFDASFDEGAVADEAAQVLTIVAKESSDVTCTVQVAFAVCWAWAVWQRAREVDWHLLGRC